VKRSAGLHHKKELGLGLELEPTSASFALAEVDAVIHRTTFAKRISSLRPSFPSLRPTSNQALSDGLVVADFPWMVTIASGVTAVPPP